MSMKAIFFNEQQARIISNLAADCRHRLESNSLYAARTCDLGSDPEVKAVDQMIDCLSEIQSKADKAAFECSFSNSKYGVRS